MVEIYESAATIVEDRFDSAQEYASDAWNTAKEYIDDLIPTFGYDLPYSRTVYTFPQIDIDSILPGEVPDPPSIFFFYNEEAYVSTLKDALTAALLTGVQDGGTGLGATVEAALWARARARQDISNARVYNEAENYFASRGFPLPPGALAGVLAEAAAEQTRADAQMNYEVSIEQARLAQVNTHFFLTTSLQLEEVEMTHAAKVAQRLFEAARYKQQANIDLYSALMQGYSSRLEATRTRLDAQVRSYAVKLEHEKNMITLKISEADRNLKAAIAEYQLIQESIKAGATVSAQMAASALSSINTAAQLGFSGSESHTHEENRAVPDVSHNYSGDI